MAFNKTFEYTTTVKGCHYFKTIWQPKENEVLVCQFENGNSYEMFSIKTCGQRETMVGHLPHGVYRFTKFIIIIIIIIIVIIIIINTLFEIEKIYIALQKHYSLIYTN